MTQSLNIIGTSEDISSGVREPEAIAQGLKHALADTYRLMFKTHAFHWNVAGPLFYSIHKLTEEHYEDMFKAADELAERMRSIGQMAPMSMAEIVANSVIQDDNLSPTTGEMCEILANDHERIAHRLHALVKIAAEQNDPVTEDLATERSAFHEQATWMLRAIIAK